MVPMHVKTMVVPFIVRYHSLDFVCVCVSIFYGMSENSLEKNTENTEVHLAATKAANNQNNTGNYLKLDTRANSFNALILLKKLESF